MTAPPSYTGRVLVEDFVGLPVAHVAPGGIYETTCCPKAEMLLSELLVRDFTLLELYIDNYFIKTREVTSSDGSRTYCLEPVDSRPARLHVRTVLKNGTDQKLPAREANFEKAPMAQETQSPRAVRLYRCKRLVEALQWTNTDENREQFSAWFKRHDAMFETRGTEIILPEQGARITIGDWILYSDGDFAPMSDQLFTDLYDLYDLYDVEVP